MKHLLDRLTGGQHLTVDEADEILVSLTESESPAMAGALLAALKTKGETPEEVRGFARAMRRIALQPDIQDVSGAVDIVGTGGDGSGSLNLSTGASLLTAAAGTPVIKHGNRSITSRCGSADVLSALGAEPPTPDRVAETFERHGFTFLFAPFFHPAMKTIAPVRQALGVRTVFNILGPLTNPAQPPFYLIGAFDPNIAALMADALSGLPIQRAFVIHGADGWDEATPIGPFRLWDVTPGSVKQEIRDPSTVGIPRCQPQDLAGGEASENAAAIRSVFEGTVNAHRDALILGAGLAFEVTSTTSDLEQGLALARSVLEDGRARSWLDAFTARAAASSEPRPAHG